MPKQLTTSGGDGESDKTGRGEGEHRGRSLRKIEGQQGEQRRSSRRGRGDESCRRQSRQPAKPRREWRTPRRRPAAQAKTPGRPAQDGPHARPAGEGDSRSRSHVLAHQDRLKRVQGRQTATSSVQPADLREGQGPRARTARSGSLHGGAESRWARSRPRRSQCWQQLGKTSTQSQHSASCHILSPGQGLRQHTLPLGARHHEHRVPDGDQGCLESDWGKTLTRTSPERSSGECSSEGFRVDEHLKLVGSVPAASTPH